MASGERRSGSGRRGMTVLGKIPTPSIPKPVNLPSQRSENRGLESNVELVPRGTFGWGSAGRYSVSKEGGSGIASSPPMSSVTWNGALTTQELSASSNDAGSLAESNRPPSAGNGTRPSSAPTAATNRVWCNSAKTKVEVQVQSSGFMVNPVEPVTLGSQKSPDLTPQQKNVPLTRPTTADESGMDRDMHPHAGINACAGAGPIPAGPSPRGFQHPGDGYNGHCPFVWQGMPPAVGHELPVGPGPYAGHLPHELYYSPFGIPQYGNAKDRDMVVVRLVNGPGIYGSYPPHFRPVECFGLPGVHGSYQPSTRHGDQFFMSGNSVMGASSCTPGMSMGSFPDGNKIQFQEGEGQFTTIHRDGGYPGMQREVDSSCNISSVSSYGSERNHRMPRTFGRHNHASGEHGNHVKDGVASAMLVPEKKITLLTRVEAPSTETTSNNPALLLDSNQGSDGCQQKINVCQIEVDEDENCRNVSAVKGVKEADEFLESKILDGDVVKMSRTDIAFSNTVGETKQNVEAVKDNLSEIEAGVAENFTPQSSVSWRKAANRREVNGLSSAKKQLALTTNESIQDAVLKAQTNHYSKAEIDNHGCKIPQQAHEGTQSSVMLESVGVSSKAVCTDPTKHIVLEDIPYRGDGKAKMKALNPKIEKEWRPKSPIVESKVPGLQVGKESEQLCNVESVKEVSECRTNSAVLEASSLSRSKKADKRRMFRNVESLSPSCINSSKEDPFLLIENSNSAESEVVEVAVDQFSQSKNERTTILEPSSNADHNTAKSAFQVLHADASKVTTTEGSMLKGEHKPKPRQLNYKGGKEWRPKSPAVDSTAAYDNGSGSQSSEANLTLTSVCDNITKTVLDLKISEEEGCQPLDAYDYEGQRAKLKEIAAQRAKQRQKEEEERIKEQKAKALAKLEELNRRTLVTPMSAETTDQGSVVCMDGVPNKRTKKKSNSSKHSFVDVPIHDSGALEKQYIDEDMVRAPAKDSTSKLASTAFHKKHTNEFGEDSKELLSDKMSLSQNSRIKRDEPGRKVSQTEETHQPHKFLTATSSFQEQQQLSRRERLIHEEDLPSAHESEVDSSSSKKFGAEIRKGDAAKPGWLHVGQRQTDTMQNQRGRRVPTFRNEVKATVEEYQELEQLSLSPVDSQTGDLQGKGGAYGKAASGQPQHISVGRLKQSKAGVLSMLDEHPFAIGSPERNTFINADAVQQSGINRSGQRHRNEMEAREQVQSFGRKQPLESIVSADASFGSENLGRSHVVSWRQKNSNHLLHSDKPFSGLNRVMESTLEESLDMPTQSWKSHKVKNAGKEYMAGRHQRGQVPVKVSAVEEKRTAVLDSAISELPQLNADISKHDVEAKASESIKTGRSYNLRRQKNVTNGSHIFKQASMKELNEKHLKSLAVTESFEEIVDPPQLNAASTSNPHNPTAHIKQSPRSALEAPQWHKHCSVKLANSTLSPGRAGSQVPVDQLRFNVASMQGWETEQLQDSKSSTGGYSGKHSLQLQAEPKPVSETNAHNRNYKNQQVFLSKATETISDQHAFSNKLRSNHTHVENRRMNRQHQAGHQAFRPGEEHHEAENETRNNCGEQRISSSSRGREKPLRKSQFNGCVTVVELDRISAEPSMKTEISY